MTSPKSAAKTTGQSPRPLTNRVPSQGPLLVVAHLKDRMVKGELLQNSWPFWNGSSPEKLQVRLLSTGTTEDIRLKDAKAVFLVRNLQGNFRRNSVLFHHERPPQKSLWVRIIFNDGEELEGMLDNSTDLINQPALRLIPTDPDGNNLEIYIPKASIRDFCVLGLRN